jgi:hypothetical protein
MTSLSSSLDPDATQSAPEFIEIRGISKRFGGVRALQDVSFSILAAEIHSLAGENGCGKSTLIKVLSGVHAPDEGEIVLEGKSHSHLSPAASQRFGIQIIYQDLSLFPNLRVAENIAFRHHVETPVRLSNSREMRKQAQEGLHCFVYGYSGVTAGIAGLVQAHRVEEVVPNALIGRELDVLAAVVLGGASLQGGIGTVSGAVFGIVLLAIIQNGLTLLGVSSYSFGFVTGVIILISVSATAIAAERQHKKVVGNAV